MNANLNKEQIEYIQSIVGETNYVTEVYPKEVITIDYSYKKN